MVSLSSTKAPFAFRKEASLLMLSGHRSLFLRRLPLKVDSHHIIVAGLGVDIGSKHPLIPRLKLPHLLSPKIIKSWTRPERPLGIRLRQRQITKHWWVNVSWDLLYILDHAKVDHLALEGVVVAHIVCAGLLWTSVGLVWTSKVHLVVLHFSQLLLQFLYLLLKFLDVGFLVDRSTLADRA